MKGIFSEPEHKKYFSIEVVICDEDLDSTCASKDDVDELLSHMFMQTYVLEEKI